MTRRQRLIGLAALLAAAAGEQVVVIDLAAGRRTRRLVLEVADPVAVAAAL